MTPNDKQIRTSIAALIQVAVPLSIVFPRWILGYDPAEWPALLRSPSDGNRAHGWIVTQRNDDGTVKGQRCIDRDYTYAVWGFHYYDTGNDALNSEDLFSAEREAVVATLDKDLAPLLPQLSVRTPVSFQYDLFPFGGELMHVAQGRLVVRPCC